MKIEIVIDENELKELVLNKMAQTVVNDLVGDDWSEEGKKKRNLILDKIDWK